MTKKETLNVLIADGAESKSYIDYLNICFDVNVLDYNKSYKSNEIDLLLFTGGADVDPELYEENVGKFTGINKARDEKETNIFWKYNSVPKLGICRGAQFLTVMSGGKLIQHTVGHTKEHLIDIPSYGQYMITSTHHQMMYPYNLPKDYYKLRAWSTKFLSNTYLNGDNQEIELDKEFLEPEIVEYPKSKAFCIQGHPEFANKNIQEITLKMISRFLESFKVKFSKYKAEEDSDYEWEIVDKGQPFPGSRRATISYADFKKEASDRDSFIYNVVPNSEPIRRVEAYIDENGAYRTRVVGENEPAKVRGGKGIFEQIREEMHEQVQKGYLRGTDGANKPNS